MNYCEPETIKKPPENRETEEGYPNVNRKNHLLPISILISAIIVAGTWIYITGLKVSSFSQKASLTKGINSVINSEEDILPSKGVILPVKWGDIGTKLVDSGVIDKQKLESAYYQRGGISNKDWELINSGNNNDDLIMTSENSGLLLNLFWAFGLSNKNEILEKGPMNDPQYGGAGNFASTGGWTLAKGKAMDHYSKYNFVSLTPEQQALVEKVSKGIYRPCCGNSTYFPDCNHGMAMLGFLELMASQGKTEEEMYQAALVVNSFWFPSTYQTIAKLMESRGIQWKDVNSKEVLGANFSSASGYRRVLSQIQPVQSGGGNSCGI